MDTQLNPPSSDQGSRTLADFGITTFIDDEGVLQFSLDVEVGQGSARAVLDQSQCRWRLEGLPAVNGYHRSSNHFPDQKLKLQKTTAHAKWTDALPQNENFRWFLDGVDWRQTEFGPLESWPISLQTLVKVVMSDACPAVIYWGPRFLACYNLNAHRDVSARFGNHRLLQGKPFKEIWHDVWSDLEPYYQTMQAATTSTDSTKAPVFALRANGRLEETFWTGTIFPIRGEKGVLEGIYNRAIDVTNETVRERRASTLDAIAVPPSDPGLSVWHGIFTALRNNGTDFPMAIGYSAEDDGVGCHLTLQQTIGLPSGGHPLVPPTADIYEGSTGFSYYYRKIRSCRKPIILHREDGTLPQDFLRGFEWQGYGDVPTAMAFIPIAVSARLLGIIVVCLNPRRTFQDEDKTFIKSLCHQFSATLAIAIDREAADMRAERMTKELAEHEKQIRDIAEYGPGGMARLTPTGSIVWVSGRFQSCAEHVCGGGSLLEQANSQYFEITGHSTDDYYDLSFMDAIHADEHARASSIWSVLTVEHKHISAEFRLNRKWRPPPTAGNPHPKEEHSWVLANAFPVLEDNQLKSVVASVTDISKTKWTEEIQSRLATEATQARKLQEAFIDIVSHEMRNPLSAITQLADSVAASFEDLQLESVSLEATLAQLEENVESGKTILLCAAHQKRVIDDVLTLSKLDSQLLSISPVAVQTGVVLDTVLKMFQAEFETHDITVESTVDDSYQIHNIDWLALDPARLTQIFINLLTNAIKFIKQSSVRRITLRRSAFIGKTPTLSDVTWFPTNKPKRDLTLDPEWGKGEQVYLLFSVSDTGKGLEQDEMMRLFNRFQQATKKTHIKYGGSGLGLFIARELTENMGGEIGVVSAPGHGSTFAFYVKARRATKPKEPDIMLAPLRSSIDARRTSLHLLDFAKRRHTAGDGSPVTTRPNVLLVEDNLINAQVLTKQLERAGCMVSIANHGQEALDFLQTTVAWTAQSRSVPKVDIDCILMDVEMPVLDGLSCTRKIREFEANGQLSGRINIIAITANARQEQIQSAFDAGVDEVLPKPFRVGEVLAKMNEIASKDYLQS